MVVLVSLSLAEPVETVTSSGGGLGVGGLAGWRVGGGLPLAEDFGGGGMMG